jgi:hypothetical protein
MELVSGMGFPPPWGANEDYHFFFKNSNQNGGRPPVAPTDIIEAGPKGKGAKVAAEILGHHYRQIYPEA